MRVELWESLVAAKATSVEKTKAGRFVNVEWRTGAEQANTGVVGPEVPGNNSHQLA